MTAGESAREVARKSREKARRLERFADAYDRGAAGEEATAAALAGLPAGWTVVHDVRWPGRAKANIDHVVLGPGGLFVIDTKHWAGKLTVADDVLRQNGRAREKAIAGVADAALAVTSAIGHLPAVPVLCFVREEAMTGWARDVMVCSTASLVEMLVTRPRTLHQAAISRILPALERNLVTTSAAPARDRRARRSRRSSSTSSSSSSRRRRNEGPSLRRLVATVVGALALILVGIPVLKAVSNDVTQRIVSGLDKSAEFGSAQTIAADSGHPELRVVVGRPSDTSAGDGAKPTAGRHLVAVPITVVNKGDRSWTWDEQTRLILVDAVGTSYAPTYAYRTVVAGRALRGSPTLAQGRTLERVAVFEVPAKTRIARVLLAVGHGLSTTWRWE